MRNKVRNTTEDAHRDAPFIIAAAMMGMNPLNIEAQESAGQAQYCMSDTLPTKGVSKEQLESMGFIVPSLDTGDALFRYAALPEGWTKQATDHAMWSEILDERGYVRIRVFYKAAFYDLRAEAHLAHRYEFGGDYSEGNLSIYERIDRRCFVWDKGPMGTLFASTSTEYQPSIDECRAWLAANKPDYENPLAYWDLP